jgi:hypothetical protein
MALSNSEVPAADATASSTVGPNTVPMVRIVKVSFSSFNSAEGDKYGIMDEYIQFPKGLVLPEVEATGFRIWRSLYLGGEPLALPGRGGGFECR